MYVNRIGAVQRQPPPPQAGKKALREPSRQSRLSASSSDLTTGPGVPAPCFTLCASRSTFAEGLIRTLLSFEQTLTNFPPR
jgi:hypothetical protein